LGFPIANADGSGAGFNSQSAVTGITLANAGGGGAHNNLQPSLVVCKIIKF
jgi:microcystin-dependent protein